MPANRDNATQAPAQELVFLFDVDNTLLDNDRVKADISERLDHLLGSENSPRFWEIYEQVRKDLDVVSWPDTLERFAQSWPNRGVSYKLANLINSWPYEEYLYPGTIPALEHVTRLGEVGILSDGDTLYQPRKIARAGLARIVGHSDVLIFTHKQDHFEDIMRRLPGTHYVLVDDKESILADAKKELGKKLTTVWVRQGKYAFDPKHYREPAPDITIDAIGDLCRIGREEFLNAG